MQRAIGSEKLSDSENSCETSGILYNRREKSAAVYLFDFVPAFSFYCLPKVLNLTGSIASLYWISNESSDAVSHLCINPDAATHAHLLRGWSSWMFPTLRRQRLDNHRGLIKCWQFTRCSVSGTPLQHPTAPHSPPCQECSTIRCSYFSCSTSPGRLMLYHSHSEEDLLTATAPSLCFGADLKKGKKSMKLRVDWTPPFPRPSAPFWKDNVKFNSENNSNLTLFSRAAVIYDEKTLAECKIRQGGATCLAASLTRRPEIIHVFF